MGNVKILDCTLRDGGFVNNWQFGHSCINNIVDRLDRANIEFIEVGYIRNGIEYRKDSTEYPDTRTICNTLIHRDYRHEILALFDYGKCSIDNITPKRDSLLDGIRITFRKNETHEALEVIKEVKEMGYKVFVQPVAITDYCAHEVIDLVERVNCIKPYAVCMVDTYGFMNKRELDKYFYLFDSSLEDGIELGYHSHNNYQLSYSNAIYLLEKSTTRDVIVDASVLGMGKGAGNLNTELITSYINENIQKKYNVESLLEIISIYLEKERQKMYWGYGLKYFMAANQNVHHGYVQYLLDKKTLTIKAVNEILAMIPAAKKTSYDFDIIKQLYESYQNKYINDGETIQKLKQLLAGKKIVIIAPGGSINREEKAINNALKNAFVIDVNHYMRKYRCDMIFVSNAVRYSQLETECRGEIEIPVVATSNISFTLLRPDFIVKYQELVLDDFTLDNAVLHLLQLLVQIGIKSVSIAGFDGYENTDLNYYDMGISLDHSLEDKNENIIKGIEFLRKYIEIIFITRSKFDCEEMH